MEATTAPATVGHRNDLRRLSNELFRHAINGPTPVSSSRNIAIGILILLKNGASTLIFSPVNFSEMTGNSVPHRIAKQLASRTRLLNRKLDSRDSTLSSCDSLFRKSSRLTIRVAVAATPMLRNTTKYIPIGPLANACTEFTIPLRVKKVPKMHRKKVDDTSTMF